MTTFEQELINAIRHKCPFCRWDILAAQCYVAVWASHPHYDPDQTPALERLTWDSKVDYLNTTDRIVCGSITCEKELWTSGDGWIPELADIVKGE